MIRLKTKNSHSKVPFLIKSSIPTLRPAAPVLFFSHPSVIIQKNLFLTSFSFMFSISKCSFAQFLLVVPETTKFIHKVNT